MGSHWRPGQPPSASRVTHLLLGPDVSLGQGGLLQEASEGQWVDSVVQVFASSTVLTSLVFPLPLVKYPRFFPPQ